MIRAAGRKGLRPGVDDREHVGIAREGEVNHQADILQKSAGTNAAIFGRNGKGHKYHRALQCNAECWNGWNLRRGPAAVDVE